MPFPMICLDDELHKFAERHRQGISGPSGEAVRSTTW